MSSGAAFETEPKAIKGKQKFMKLFRDVASLSKIKLKFALMRLLR